MTVSYSNELSLAVITTGTESGTWGTLTNDNFQYALTQAIGGKASLTFTSTTYTLTASANNGLQDFRALFLTCSGSPGAASTLVVPAINKPYLIKNNLTGGFDLTVKIGSSTGTVIPSGQTMFLYANGSDVIPANDYFTSLTARSFTVTRNSELGSAPVEYTGCSWTISAGVATITQNSHGFVAGEFVTLDFSGTTPPADGRYQILGAPNAPTTNTFAVSVGSGSGSGTVDVYESERLNLYSDVFTNNSAGTFGQVLTSRGSDRPPQWTTISTNSISQGDSNVTVTDTSTVTTGTYSRSGFIVTVTTASAHGFSTGQAVSLDFTTGTATDGVYPITVTSSTEFTINDTVSGTTSGNVSITTTGTITLVTDGVTRATVGGASGTGILKTNAYRDITIAVASGTYTRSGTTITVTTPSAHGFVSGQSLYLDFAFVATGLSATYGRSGTTVTVTTTTNHGFATGQPVFLTFSAGTGGTATTGSYTATVTGNTTFTVTDSASGTITGTPAVTISECASDNTYFITVTNSTTFTATDSITGTISSGAVGIAPGSGFGFNGDIWYGV